MNETAKLVASDGATGDELGSAVATDGDIAVAGAHRDDVGTNWDQGSAYVFVKPNTGWAGTMTEAAKLTASDGAALDLFGNEVAVSGGTVVVGAPWSDVGAKFDQGSAYVFANVPAPSTTTTTTTSTTTTTLPPGTCPATPLASCDVPQKAVIVIKDNNDDTRDRFKVRLIRNAPERTGAELGDPTAAAIYTTCVWSNSAPFAELVAPPGPNWVAASTKGYKYRDRSLTSDGLKLLKVLAGPEARPRPTKAIVVGAGVNLPDPPLPIPEPVDVTVQVIDSETGICFGQTFDSTHVRKNGANRANTVRAFKAVNR